MCNHICTVKFHTKISFTLYIIRVIEWIYSEVHLYRTAISFFTTQADLHVLTVIIQRGAVSPI